MKLGDRTKEIWVGDIVVECEYIADLGQGRMLFYDITTKCFRRVYFELYEGNAILNGWDCAKTVQELL